MNLTRRSFLKLSGAAIAFLSMGENLFAKGGAIPVLLYHDISDEFRDGYTIPPSLFSAQMEWLYSNGYRTLSFKEIGTFMEKSGEKVVIITFDDGYASFMDYAFPLFKEYNFKATINIIGQPVGSFIRLGGNRPLLSWDEYRYLKKSGLVDLGCHTYNLHSGSGALAVSEKELENDLLFFQEVIKKETGSDTEILAWPYGKYNKKSVKIARKAGFKYLLTSNEGHLNKESNLDEIPRLNLNDRFDLVSFQQYIRGKT